MLIALVVGKSIVKQFTFFIQPIFKVYLAIDNKFISNFKRNLIKYIKIYIKDMN